MIIISLSSVFEGHGGTSVLNTRPWIFEHLKRTTGTFTIILPIYGNGLKQFKGVGGMVASFFIASLAVSRDPPETLVTLFTNGRRLHIQRQMFNKVHGAHAGEGE